MCERPSSPPVGCHLLARERGRKRQRCAVGPGLNGSQRVPKNNRCIRPFTSQHVRCGGGRDPRGSESVRAHWPRLCYISRDYRVDGHLLLVADGAPSDSVSGAWAKVAALCFPSRGSRVRLSSPAPTPTSNGSGRPSPSPVTICLLSSGSRALCKRRRNGGCDKEGSRPARSSSAALNGASSTSAIVARSPMCMSIGGEATPNIYRKIDCA